MAVVAAKVGGLDLILILTFSHMGGAGRHTSLSPLDLGTLARPLGFGCCR